VTILERIRAFAYGAFWAGLLSTFIGAVIIALAHDWGFVPYGVGEAAGLTSSVITGAIIGGIYFLWSAVKRAQLAQELEDVKEELRQEIERQRDSISLPNR
jgi:cobalamin biosynthesis protein CobD/CbiB